MSTIITKIDYISKTKSRTKKCIDVKIHYQINSNLPCIFGHFWRKFNFWGPKTSLFDAHNSKTRYDFFSTLRIVYVQKVTSEGGEGGGGGGGGGGGCIFLVGKKQIFETFLVIFNSGTKITERLYLRVAYIISYFYDIKT